MHLKSSTYFKAIFRSIAIVSSVAVLLSSCHQSSIEQVKAFSHAPGSPEVIADDYSIMYSDSGRVRFKLTTPKMLVFSDENEPYKEFPNGFLIERYDQNFKITSSIKADYGKLLDKKNIWEAKHNVIALNESGDSLFTEQLFWDDTKGKIYSDKYVKIIQKNAQLEAGVGFEANQQMTWYKFKKIQSPSKIEIDN